MANEKQLEARLQFLLAVMIAQNKHQAMHNGGPSGRPHSQSKMELYRSRYLTTSAFSLANDLGVPHEELKKRQVALKYLKQ